MSWDPIWEKIFKERDEWGKYPIEDLVRFIAKNYYSKINRNKIKILEIGCGLGGGPGWYIAREGFSYTGFDGSITAIEKVKNRFKEDGLSGEFVKGDFVQLPWENETFDAVIDIVSLQCNSEASTALIIKEVYRVLKSGGLHFSYTSKAGCWGDGTGIKIDNTTYQDVSEGPFSNMGIIRFATEDNLKAFYSNFINMDIEYTKRSLKKRTREISYWIVSCQKR